MLKLRSPAKPWPPVMPAVPPELLTQPGIGRDPAAELAAFRRDPVHEFFRLHSAAWSVLAPKMAIFILPVLPGLVRSTHRLSRAQTAAQRPTNGPTRTDPAGLTARLRRQADRLGISAIGITGYDPKYELAEFAGSNVGDRVVVCVLEQHYRTSQTQPSAKAERAALSTYAEVQDKVVRLVDWLRALGYQARPEPFDGESLFIPYAVAAGLGQLGLNGQLLTPYAGSRCRLIIATTNAPLVLDAPVDYGIEGICDRCQVCVRRCPVGAITAHRAEYRGIIKAKINTKRCLPVVAQAAGCAVCTKVCPIQRYGLPAVLDHYRVTGRIRGKDTDELEGYDWPLDGRHYPPEAKPRVPNEVLRPEGYHFDPPRLA